MTDRRIRVYCYAGGRGDERPRRVFIDNRAHTVTRLLDSRIEEAFDSRKRAFRYTVQTEKGAILEILRAQDGCWYLVSEKRDR